jgi:predicted anti-sigma-YlaC factor YlaD
MGIQLLFGAISFIWGVIGVILTVAPTVWMGFAQNFFTNSWARFWTAQVMLLIGLVLIIGTATLQGFWLWVGCGVLAVIKAFILLGSSEAFRIRLTTMATTRSLWVYRSSGILTLILAVLLAADTILHG